MPKAAVRQPRSGTDRDNTPSDQQNDAGSATSSITTGFQFVSYSPTNEAKSKSGSFIVRSHAARHHWNRDLAVRHARKANASKRRKPQVQVVLEGVEQGVVEDVEYSDHSSESETSSRGSVNSFELPHIEWLVGGTRVDPFQSFPTQWKPHFSFVVDHYLVHMAVDIPELDQSNRGSLRSNWFPLALNEPSLFLAIILLASCHYSAVSRTLGSANLLRFKQEAPESINEALRGNQDLVSDALIGSVAKMASYEAMYGDVETYMAHMSGLKRMVELRGGLAQLGLGGLLRRMIIWIDTNAAFLNNLPLYFPNEIFAEMQAKIEPDPGHFIGTTP